MMHEWEKQDKLLEKIEEQKLENCLVYNSFAYEKQEWDNIPGIVPRYVIYLAKYMEGIVNFCHNQSLCETTKDLRLYTENTFDSTNVKIDDLRQQDLYEKEKINNNHKALK